MVFVYQVFGDGLGEGKPVEGGGAAPDFVHQHERLRGGVVQDVGGFGHFHHKGGAVACQIVGCADAGVDLVYGADGGGFGGNVAAGVGEQGDEGDLAHIGGFAAHVGAGEQGEAAAGRELGVIGGEVLDLLFYYGMPPVLDV